MTPLSIDKISQINAHIADQPGGDRAAAVEAMRRAIRDAGLETVRFVFADQHGVTRGKTLVGEEALSVMEKGINITTTMVLKDTSHRTVFPIWESGGGFGVPEFQGAADLVMRPDPATFRILPWSPQSGWVLCDLFFKDGRAMPLSARQVMRDSIAELDTRGFDFVAGLEVEFHIFRLEDPLLTPAHATQPGTPPQVSLVSRGYQYLTEQLHDQMEPVLDILRRNIQALALPLRSVEVEFGPSQCEFVFAPTLGMVPADLMVLFRTAIKQVAARHGYHATFMCRPQIANGFASGWHLHQSLRAKDDGRNLFMACADNTDATLSELGQHYLGGLLHHARASALFSTPTINGYKRYRSFSLAPDRAIWGQDNRGVMARVLGAPGDSATRIENRIGEPLANPYLYMASQIWSGLDGIDQRRNPGPSADAPYATDAPLLPQSMAEALHALSEDQLLHRRMGQGFVDYYRHIKAAELARFNAAVTDWEQREYFDLF